MYQVNTKQLRRGNNNLLYPTYYLSLPRTQASVKNRWTGVGCLAYVLPRVCTVYLHVVGKICFVDYGQKVDDSSNNVACTSGLLVRIDLVLRWLYHAQCGTCTTAAAPVGVLFFLALIHL